MMTPIHTKKEHANNLIQKELLFWHYLFSQRVWTMKKDITEFSFTKNCDMNLTFQSSQFIKWS